MFAITEGTRNVYGKEITIELKSVNNRYFDCSIKVPRSYGSLEEKIKHYTEHFWQPEQFSQEEIDACLTCHFL